MDIRHRGKIYVLIFCLSCQILMLQVVLSLLLNVYSYEPFLAVSFAFLGMSAAGVYATVRYFGKPVANLSGFLTRNLTLSGVLFLLDIGVMKYASILKFKSFERLLRLPGLPWHDLYDYILVNIFSDSLMLGILFSFAFFSLGLILAMVYKSYSESAPKLYWWDLLGAAAGCGLAVYLLHFFHISSILIFLTLVLFILALVIGADARRSLLVSKVLPVLILLTGALLVFNMKTDVLELKINPDFLAGDTFKECEEVYTAWNAYSRIALLQNKEPADRDHEYLFIINGNSGRAVPVPFEPEAPYRFKLFQDFSPVTLAFLRDEPRNILIIFAGAGKDMIEAYSYSRGRADITGVELNPLIVRRALKLEGYHLPEFFAKDNVHMIVSEGRSFLEKTHRRYDAIIYSWAGASYANYLGTAGYTGQYLFTKEAIVSCLKHLKPGGIIGIVNSNKIRVTGMVRAALDELGETDAAKKIAIFERRSTLADGDGRRRMFSPDDGKFFLMSNEPLSENDIARMSKKISKMDMEWITHPYYSRPDFTVYRDLMNSRDPVRFTRALSDIQFRDLTIATDDRPFQQNAFVFSNLFAGDFWKMFSPEYRARYPAYYALHSFTICFILWIILVGFLLIIFPLFRGKKLVLTVRDAKLLYYFAALGLGFIFVEITVMNQFNLLLGNPIYAFSVILATLLIATGLGSLSSVPLFARGILNIPRAGALASGLLAGYYFLLPRIIQGLLGMPFAVKVGMTFVTILPLGLTLGMLFPQGLKRLHRSRPDLIPWAWAINGYMSVTGSVISCYLPIYAGFSVLLLVAAVMYLTIPLWRIRLD